MEHNNEKHLFMFKSAAGRTSQRSQKTESHHSEGMKPKHAVCRVWQWSCGQISDHHLEPLLYLVPVICSELFDFISIIYLSVCANISDGPPVGPSLNSNVVFNASLCHRHGWSRAPEINNNKNRLQQLNTEVKAVNLQPDQQSLSGECTVGASGPYVGNVRVYQPSLWGRVTDRKQEVRSRWMRETVQWSASRTEAACTTSPPRLCSATKTHWKTEVTGT